MRMIGQSVAAIKELEPIVKNAIDAGEYVTIQVLAAVSMIQ